MIKKQQDLTEGNIKKGFFMFALPLLGSSLFQQLYSTVDLLFVGNLLGKSAAAAVGASGILVTCLIGLFTGVSVGTGVLAAQYKGAGEEEKIKKVTQTALTAGLAGGVFFMLLGFAIARSSLNWLQTPENIVEEALAYVRVYLLSIVPMVLYNMCAAVLRALGDSRTPFLVLAAGGGLNVCLDALLIGCIPLGVKGAAGATVLSQTFTAGVLYWYVFRKKRLAEIAWQADKKELRKIMILGCPVGVQSMIITLSNMFVQYYINGFGEDAVAAFAVYFKAENIIYLPIMAFGQAMVTFTGQNIGAGKDERIYQGIRSCNLLAAGTTGVISAVCLAFGNEILSTFCQDGAVVEQGLRIIWVSFPCYFIYAVMEVTGGVIRGIGKSLESMLIVIFSLCIIRVLLLAVIVKKVHDIGAVASVYPMTWLVALLLFTGCYVRWKRGRMKS